MARKKSKEQKHTTSEELMDSSVEINDAEPKVSKNEGVADGKEVSAEEKMKTEVKELNDKYLRLYSEFDNFRRRTAKERLELFKTAGQEVLSAMLPILDDFERAIRSMEDTNDIKALKDGINLVYMKMVNVLDQQGLKAFEAKGEPFDADLHEAVTKIPAPSDDLKGKIVDELEKGYKLNDKILRYAKVVVGE